MKHNFIKSLFLSTVLSLSFQLSPLAMQNDDDTRDLVHAQAPYGQSAPGALFVTTFKGSSFQDFPYEVIKYFVDCFDLKKDQNALLSLMKSCTEFQASISDRYKKLNEQEHHYPWSENPSLYPSTVYILNNRLRTILGLYVNIGICENMSTAFDRDNFRRLSTQFMDKSLFPEDSLPNMYVDLLQCSVNTQFAVADISSLQRLLTTNKEKCVVKFSNIPPTLNFQNEFALWFHFCLFVLKMPDTELSSLEDTDLFRGLNSSLMGVMNKELLTLKGTPGLDDSPTFVEMWKRIIDLESAITPKMLKLAADAYTLNGKKKTDRATKAESHAKAAAYYEERLKALKDSRISPGPMDYRQTSNSFWAVGLQATDPVTKAENFAKAATYFEEEIKALKAMGANPHGDIYMKISACYTKAGENTTDPAIKDVFIAKADAYIKEGLQIYNAWKQDFNADIHPQIKADEYLNIGRYYFQLGQATTDPASKHESNINAAEYLKLSLSLRLDEDSTKQAKDMLKAISPSE